MLFGKENYRNWITAGNIEDGKSLGCLVTFCMVFHCNLWTTEIFPIGVCLHTVLNVFPWNSNVKNNSIRLYKWNFNGQKVSSDFSMMWIEMGQNAIIKKWQLKKNQFRKKHWKANVIKAMRKEMCKLCLFMLKWTNTRVVKLFWFI